MPNTNLPLVVYSDSVIAAARPLISVVRHFSVEEAGAETRGSGIRVPLKAPSSVAAFNASSNNFDRPDADVIDVEVPLAIYITGDGVPFQRQNEFNDAWWDQQGRDYGFDLANFVRTQFTTVLKNASTGGSPAWTPRSVSSSAGTPLNLKGAALAAAIYKMAFKWLDGRQNNLSDYVLALDPIAFANLLEGLTADVYGGNEAVRNGEIPGLFGFKAVLPLPGLNANTGYLLQRQNIAVGSRQLYSADDSPYSSRELVTFDDVGMSILNTIYTSGASGKMSFSSAIQFGISVGLAVGTGVEGKNNTVALADL